MNRILLLAILFLLPTIIVALAPIDGLGLSTTIPDQYIVVLHKNTTMEMRDRHVNELVAMFGTRAMGEKIIDRYLIGDFVAYGVFFYKDLLLEILDHPLVSYVSADQIVTINDDAPESDIYEPNDEVVTQSGATWGISRIDQRAGPPGTSYSYWASSGEGVAAYIIDTGILLTHNEFTGRASFGVNTVGDNNNADCNGHGTHVAGTVGGAIYGVAKKTTLIAVKVLNCSGSGAWTGVASGIQWVADDKRYTKKVGNMSLGGGVNQAADDATRACIATGTHMAIAAGNSNADACNYSPARVATALTAGATTDTDARASFSNYGSCVDAYAPGNLITSAWIGSNTATSTISGTSMASPHFCGAIVIHLGHLGDANLNPADLHAWFLRVATPGVVTGTNNIPNIFIYSPTSDI